MKMIEYKKEDEKEHGLNLYPLNAERMRTEFALSTAIMFHKLLSNGVKNTSEIKKKDNE